VKKVFAEFDAKLDVASTSLFPKKDEISEVAKVGQKTAKISQWTLPLLERHWVS